MKFLKDFHKILKENFTQSSKKIYTIFERISCNFKKNFIQILRKFH